MSEMQKDLARVLQVTPQRAQEIIDLLDVDELADLSTLMAQNKFDQIRNSVQDIIDQLDNNSITQESVQLVSQKDPYLNSLLSRAIRIIKSGGQEDVQSIIAKVFDPDVKDLVVHMFDLIGDIQSHLMSTGRSIGSAMNSQAAKQLEGMGVSLQLVKEFIQADTPELVKETVGVDELNQKQIDHHRVSRIKWLMNNKGVDLETAIDKYSKDFNSNKDAVKATVMTYITEFDDYLKENQASRKYARIFQGVQKLMRANKLSVDQAAAAYAHETGTPLRTVEYVVDIYRNQFDYAKPPNAKMNESVVDKQVRLLNLIAQGRSKHTVFESENPWEINQILKVLDSVSSGAIKHLFTLSENELSDIHAKSNGFQTSGIRESRMTRSQLIDSIISTWYSR